MGKRIAVVGVGALGGYVGGWLAHTGEDVTLIDFWPENIETIRKNGLELDGVTPEEKITVKNAKTLHLTEVQQLAKEKPVDIAFVCTKSYDTAWATMMIKQYLAPDGFVVSLQNCLNEERIAGVVGWGKTVGMVASLISVDMFEPARIRRTVAKGGDKHTVFRVGEVHGRLTRRVEELRDMVGRIDSAKTTTKGRHRTSSPFHVGTNGPHPPWSPKTWQVPGNENPGGRCGVARGLPDTTPRFTECSTT